MVGSEKKKVMENRKFLLGAPAIVMVCGLILAGCATTEVFVEGIPPDQQATFYVPGGNWDVYEFSGKTVKWYTMSSFGYTTVTIPSGQHTVKFHYYHDAFNHFNDKELTAYFEPGHLCALNARQAGRDIYFGIYDTTAGKFITPMPE